ncbi:hypothetical protein [Nibrella saemangeumensis]
MQLILKLLSYIGLLLTVLPAFGVFYGFLSVGQHKTLMLVGMLLWFATASALMLKSQPR